MNGAEKADDSIDYDCDQFKLKIELIGTNFLEKIWKPVSQVLLMWMS